MCVKEMGYWSDQEVVREAHKHNYNVLDWESRKAAGDTSGNREISGFDQGGDGRPKTQDMGHPAGRNPRSVVTPKPESYSGAHYAAYPTSLIAPLIRATCPSRCCPACGAGWSPVVEKTGEYTTQWGSNQNLYKATTHQGGDRDIIHHQSYKEKMMVGIYESRGYRPTCDCGREDWRPGIVFDPFLGSGTTLQVAKDLMMRGAGLDLAHTYLDEQAKVRAQIGAPSNALDDLPLFNLGIDSSTEIDYNVDTT
jgi:hypothetical protein